MLYQFQLVLLRSREEVMKKVVRAEDNKAIILALPFDRQLPDAAGILRQHYKLLVQRNPGVKEWMVRAPMVAHLRPANLRDFLVRAKLPPVDNSVCYNVTCSHGAGQCLRKSGQYVGKVGDTRPCRTRCTEHRGAVRNHWDTGVGDFNLPGHDLANFNFLPFEKVRSSDPFVLETRENY